MGIQITHISTFAGILGDQHKNTEINAKNTFIYDFPHEID